MEKNKLTAIQLQVVKSIEKAIKKDQADLKRNKIRFENNLKKLEDQIADLKGFFAADQELLEDNIRKSQEALSIYIGDDVKIEEELTKKADDDSKSQDCTVECNNTVDKTEYASDAHKKEVEDLPWTTRSTEEIDQPEDDMPFGGIFSKK